MIKIYMEKDGEKYEIKSIPFQTTLTKRFKETFVKDINEAKIQWLSAVLQNKECYMYNKGQQIGANVPLENRAYFNDGE
jgi:hypothetical protein